MTTRPHHNVLIVGGGHAGAQAAIALRQHGFAGSVAIASLEPELPYERPPLSKEYLAGEKSAERILIRPPAFWAEREIAMLLAHEVVAVAADARIVRFGDGSEAGYEHLIWAAGGTPRRLRCPGHDLPHVHTVRTKADADRIAAALPDVRRVAVIGGGYIGLEAAAVMRKLGREVVLLEAADRVLSRVAGDHISRFFESEHRAHGVDARLGVRDDAITADGVHLVGGETVPADLVIVGIGIDAAIAPLAAAGAATGNGVHVDAYCRTSLPGIYAIGDCAAHENAFADGARIRLESVQNAHDQANVVARALTGATEPYAATPWFWSNQYDLKLQTVGISQGHDAQVVRGDPATRSFSIVYLRRGQIVALDCVNMVRDYVQGRKLIEARARPSADALADSRIALKDLVPG